MGLILDVNRQTDRAWGMVVVFSGSKSDDAQLMLALIPTPARRVLSGSFPARVCRLGGAFLRRLENCF